MTEFFQVDPNEDHWLKRAKPFAKRALRGSMMWRPPNEVKVVKLSLINRISAAHLVGTTGYGYDDMGRDAPGQGVRPGNGGGGRSGANTPSFPAPMP